MSKAKLPEGKKFNPDYAKFVAAYLANGENATDAARAAGYSPKSAHSQGSRLLQHVEVQSRISKARGEWSSKFEVTRERVIAELAKLSFSNMKDFIDDEGRVDLKNLTRDQMAAISEITTETYMEGKGDQAEPVKRVKLKLAEKHKSLELLGRQFGLSNVAVTMTIRDERPDLTLASDDDLAILEAASQVMARLTGPVVEGTATEIEATE